MILVRHRRLLLLPIYVIRLHASQAGKRGKTGPSHTRLPSGRLDSYRLNPNGHRQQPLFACGLFSPLTSLSVARLKLLTKMVATLVCLCPKLAHISTSRHLINCTILSKPTYWYNNNNKSAIERSKTNWLCATRWRLEYLNMKSTVGR